MPDEKMTAQEFREALKQLYREFPRPNKGKETVGEWAFRLFEHQMKVSKLITDYFAYAFLGEAEEVPGLVLADPKTDPTGTLADTAGRVNWLLEQERNRRA